MYAMAALPHVAMAARRRRSQLALHARLIISSRPARRSDAAAVSIDRSRENTRVTDDYTQRSPGWKCAAAARPAPIADASAAPRTPAPALKRPPVSAPAATGFTCVSIA